MTDAATPTKPLDDVFKALPEGIKTQLTTLPEKLNKRDEQGNHLSPRMGRLIRAFRAANGGVSQKELAEKTYSPAGFMTTHCQIATLEQGGCKKGADTNTIKLLAHGLKVKPEVVEAINEADLKARADNGDAVAKKVLGIEEPKAEEPKPEPEAEKTPAAKTTTPAAKPAPSPTPAPAAKKTTVPPARPESSSTSKDKVSM